MTTENGTTETKQAALVPLTSEDNGNSVNAFASEAHFLTAGRIAKNIANSTLLPEAYRGNIPNILLAMEMAARIGGSVLALMQNLDIIHGKPGFRSTYLIATVNTCKRFTPLRFRFQGEVGTQDWGCRAVAKDIASGEECVGSLITIGMADAEGWSKKSGSKWKTMPEQMLCYRAAAFWQRLYAPELSLGMRTTDEIEDMSSVGALASAIQPLPPALVPGNAKELEDALLRGPADAPAVVEAVHIPPSEVA